jgi:putative endonuclease
LNTRAKGTEYENIAADYLLAQGYQILERNYRNPCGELDIIAEKGGVIAYIEIKYRSSNRYGNPLEAVDVKKQRRISKAAAWHYAKYGAGERKPCRFDVIGIYGDGRIQHIENAFYAQL